VAQDFKKSAGSVDQGAQQIKGSFAGIQGTIKNFIVGGGLLVAGQQIFSFVKDMVQGTIDYGLEVDALAKVTQTSYEETSKLIQVADDARIGQDQLKVALREMVDNGIQPTIENMARLSDEYLAIQDPVKRADFLMEKFGKRAGIELGRMMEMGGDGIKAAADEAERLNLVLGKDGVKAAKDYYDQMDNLNDQWEGFKMGMGGSVLPGITEFLAGINEVAAAIEEDGIIVGFLKWQQKQKEFGEELRALGLDLFSFNDILEDGIALGEIKAGMYDQDISKTRELAGATEDVAEANKEAQQTTKDWLEELDTGIDNTIANWLEQLNFMQAGGGEIQAAGAAVKQALLEGRITDAEAEYYWNELFVAAQNLQVELGNITADEAAKNIRDTLNVSLQDAKKLIDEVRRKGQFNITSTINVKVKYSDPGWSVSPGGVPHKKRAAGGPVYGGEAYWVGEMGPEPFVPAMNGSILSNREAMEALGAGGGGGDTYNEITINNYNEQAAAINTAMLWTSRRARLNASMG
jgi:hypothetical protein